MAASLDRTRTAKNLVVSQTFTVGGARPLSPLFLHTKMICLRVEDILSRMSRFFWRRTKRQARMEKDGVWCTRGGRVLSQCNTTKKVNIERASNLFAFLAWLALNPTHQREKERMDNLFGWLGGAGESSADADDDGMLAPDLAFLG